MVRLKSGGVGFLGALSLFINQLGAAAAVELLGTDFADRTVDYDLA